MKLLRLLALSLTLVCGFGCSNADLDVIDPITPDSGDIKAKSTFTISAVGADEGDLGSSSYNSKMAITDSGDNTPLTISWTSLDQVGVWTYDYDSTEGTYSQTEDLTELITGSLSDVSSDGLTATFSFSGYTYTGGTRIVYPYDAANSALSGDDYSISTINLSRQYVTLGKSYDTTSEKMYLISDPTLSTTAVMHHQTSMLKFNMTFTDSSGSAYNNASSDIYLYKVVLRKPIFGNETESELPVYAEIDLMSGIGENTNDLINVVDLPTGDNQMEIMVNNLDTSFVFYENSGNDPTTTFTVPTLPITFYPNETLEVDVYYTQGGMGGTAYMVSETYVPKMSGTTTAGVYYDMNMTFDFNTSYRTQVSASYGGGYGTESSPYEIQTAAHFNQLAADVEAGNTFEGVYFQQAGSFDGSSLSTIGSTTTPFKGTYDGNNLAITGITNSLFGYIESATVKNVIVSGASVSAYSGDLGAVVTETGSNSYVVACSVSGTVSGGLNDTDAIGSIVGRNGGAVLNCYSTAEVECAHSGIIGGLVGVNTGDLAVGFFDGSFTNVDLAVSAGALCGSNENYVYGLYYGVELTTTYTTISVTDATETDSFCSEDFVDALNTDAAEYNKANYRGVGLRLNAWEEPTSGDYAVLTTDSYPIGTLATSGESWNDLIPVTYVYKSMVDSELEGSGTEDDPWLIKTAYDFALVSKWFNTTKANGVDMSSHFLMTNDIDLSGRSWIDVGIDSAPTFDGIFDGGGHTIRGFYAVGSSASLFARTGTNGSTYDDGNYRYAVIKNLHVEDGYVSTTSAYGGGITRGFNQRGIGMNLSFTGTVSSSATSMGGIAGYSWNGTLINSCAKVTLSNSVSISSGNKNGAGIGGLTGFGANTTRVWGSYSDFIYKYSGTVADGCEAYGAILGTTQATTNYSSYVQYCYWQCSNGTIDPYSDDPLDAYFYGCALSNYPNSTDSAVQWVDNVEGAYTNVSAYASNADIVAAINSTLPSVRALLEASNGTDGYYYGSLESQLCKWKVGDDGEVALDFGNYDE